jgi:hypothetical protein
MDGREPHRLQKEYFQHDQMFFLADQNRDGNMSMDDRRDQICDRNAQALGPCERIVWQDWRNHEIAFQRTSTMRASPASEAMIDAMINRQSAAPRLAA